MNFYLKVARSTLALLSLAVSTGATAEVKSLTSNELTETYIQDSTIIVTPAQQEAPAEPRRITTYTISPSEPAEDQTAEHAEFLKKNETLRTSAASAEENARQFMQTALPNDRRQQVETPPIVNRDLNAPFVPPIQLPSGP